MTGGFEETFFFRALTGLLVGPVLGSFTTMLAYRLPRGFSIVRPPSHCPSCRARLGPRDLVPLLSWLFSKGACRHCGAKIGARYPLIELAVALPSFLAFVFLGFTWALPLALAAIVCLVTFAAIRKFSPPAS